MSDYLSEKEQWEQIRAWVRDNGPWVIAGVAVAVGLIGAWRWWQGHLDARGIQADTLYTQMITALEHGDRSAAFVRLGELERNYGSSPYADQGKMVAARVFVEDHELDKAAHELATVMESRDHALGLVARMRLARIEIAQGKPDQALGTLNAADPGAFAARYHAVRGDAYYAKGDKVAALKEYRSAQGTLDRGESALLDLKISDLVADAPTPATGAATRPAAASGPATPPATSAK
ncbi:MAG TPA: tetratricopeptide repeat protein [Steroidobacteraceae bacterium]|nr:tetratricopeptide repeat protein [Steroidobacteraceae bacterium]